MKKNTLIKAALSPKKLFNAAWGSAKKSYRHIKTVADMRNSGLHSRDLENAFINESTRKTIQSGNLVVGALKRLHKQYDL